VSSAKSAKLATGCEENSAKICATVFLRGCCIQGYEKSRFWPRYSLYLANSTKWP